MSVKSFGNPSSSFRSRFGKTGNRASKPYVYVETFSATGGNVSAISPGNGYIYHTFTSSGTFTVTSGTKTVEYLIVAGGGGGGGSGPSGNRYGGAGGGAGGLLNSTTIVSSGSYSIQVGSGGPGSNGTTNGTNGNPSYFGPIVATGGGGGGYDTGPFGSFGSTGGSGGGGGAASNPGDNKGDGTPGQGNPGGRGGFSSSISCTFKWILCWWRWRRCLYIRNRFIWWIWWWRSRFSRTRKWNTRNY